MGYNEVSTSAASYLPGTPITEERRSSMYLKLLDSCVVAPSRASNGSSFPADWVLRTSFINAAETKLTLKEA